MDIKQTKTSQMADTSSNFVAQRNQGTPTSLLYRMAVRTMHGDIETISKKETPKETPAVQPPVVKTPSVLPISTPTSIINPPESLASVPTPASANSGGLFSLLKKEKIETEKINKTETEMGREEKREEERLAKEKNKQDEVQAKQKEKEEKIGKKEAEKLEKENRKAELLAQKEVLKKEKEELLKKYEKARVDFARTDYESAIESLGGIIDDHQSSWLLKIKANMLLKKSSKELNKKQAEQTREATKIKDSENLQEIIENIPPSMPNLLNQNILSSPPPNLPTREPDQKETEPVSAPQNPLQSAVIEKLQAEKAADQNIIDDLAQDTSAPAPAKGFGLSPAATKILSEIPPEPESEKRGEALTSLPTRKLLLMAASIILVIALTGFGWWFFSSKQDNPATASPSVSPTISQTPTPSQIAAKTPFTADKQKTIQIKNGETLSEKLLLLANTQELSGTITGLILRNEQGELLTLSEAADSLNTDILGLPTQKCDETEEGCDQTETLKDLLDLTNFSFFVYSQAVSSSSASAPSSPFSSTEANSKIATTSSTVNKGRVGLVINLKDQTTSTSTNEQILKSLKDLEPLLPDELSSLLLTEKPVQPANQSFSQILYNNTSLRYLNLPTAELSIDYALFNKKLVIATSKKSMFAILDLLQKQESTQKEILISD
jgi:hypothetical protein